MLKVIKQCNKPHIYSKVVNNCEDKHKQNMININLCYYHEISLQLIGYYHREHETYIQLLNQLIIIKYILFHALKLSFQNPIKCHNNAKTPSFE